MADTDTLLVMGIIFMAALIRSTLGFGDALIAMPLLTMVLGIRMATPLVQLIGSSIGVFILIGSWRDINFGSGGKLILGAMAGIPIGLAVVGFVPADIVKGVLGILLMLYGLYSLTAPRVSGLKGEAWPYLFGLISGALGSAFGISGPPILVYGTLRRWLPQDFRATIQSVLLPSGLIILVGHALSGLWSGRMFLLYGLCMPLVIGATLLGDRLSRLFPAERFSRLVYAAFVGLGALLLV